MKTAAKTCRASKGLRIYIYDIPDALMFTHNDSSDFFNASLSLCDSDPAYSIERVIHMELLKSSTRTTNPETANLFFVPQVPVCMLHTCSSKYGTIYGKCITMATEYAVSIFHFVSTNYPYFNVSQGSDHAFIHSWDAGIDLYKHDALGKYYIRSLENAIILQNQAVVLPADPGIQPWLDAYITPRKLIAVLPATSSTYYISFVRNGTYIPREQRSLFMYFRGTVWENENYSHSIRQALKSQFNITTLNDTIISSTRAESDLQYFNELSSAVFCLAPEGWTSWSGRLAMILNAGCIPVIIADGIVLPFEPFIDWPQISAKASREMVLSGELPRFLRNYSGVSITRKLERIHAMREHFIYWKDGDHGAICYIFSEFKRMLQRRVRYSYSIY